MQCMMGFRGRCSRREFWCSSLLVLGGGVVITPLLVVLALALGMTSFWGWVPMVPGVTVLLLAIALQPFLVLAQLALAYRRAHDIDMPGGFGIVLLLTSPLLLATVFLVVTAIVPESLVQSMQAAASQHPVAACAVMAALLLGLPMLTLGAMPGSSGFNQFGPAPKHHAGERTVV